nr:uncharacterized protein LOC109427980 [Aedes albopictus]
MIVKIFLLGFALSSFFFTHGLALNCSLCTTLMGWEACDRAADYWECSDEIVLFGHDFLSDLNPTLPLNQTAAYAGGGYKCYSLEVIFGAEKQLHGFARGCTFAEVDFCSGWRSGTEVIECRTCRSEDPNSCNGAGSLVSVLWIHLVGILILAVKAL